VLHKNGVSRAILAADLWPEEDPAKSKSLLTTALSHTRTALTTVYGSKRPFGAEPPRFFVLECFEAFHYGHSENSSSR